MIKFRDTGWHEISVQEHPVTPRLHGNRIRSGFAMPEVYHTLKLRLIEKYPAFEVYDKLFEEFGGFMDYFHVSEYQELSRAEELLALDYGYRDKLKSRRVAFKFWLHPDADSDLMLLKLAGHEINKIAYHETQMLTMPTGLITNYIHIIEPVDMPTANSFAYAQSKRVEQTINQPAEMPQFVKDLLNAK